MASWDGGWRVHSAILRLYAWFETFHNIRQLSNEVVSKKYESLWALCIDTKCSGWVLGGVLRDPTWRAVLHSGSFTERRLWTGRGRSKGATVKELQMLTHMSQLRNLGCSARDKGLGGGKQSCSQPHRGLPGLGLCPHTHSAGSAQRSLWPSLSLEPHLPSPRPYTLLPLPQALRPRGSRVTLPAKRGSISPLSHKQHESAPLAQPKTPCSLACL